MTHPIKRLLCGVLCATAVGLASAAAYAPIPDLTNANGVASTNGAAPATQAATRRAAAPGDLAGQTPVSFFSNDDDSDDSLYSGPGTAPDTPLTPASPRHIAALLLAGVTLLAYRTRNVQPPVRIAH